MNDVRRSRPVNNVGSNRMHQSKSAQRVLQCFYTNSDSVLNKKSELLTVIENECIDIICITETLPKNHGGKIVPVEFQLPGFDCFHNLNEEQCSRGVALWVKTSYGAQQIKLSAEHQSARESVWCELSLKGKDSLLIDVMYRSPKSSSDNDKVLKSLLLPSMTFNRSHTLIVGDFNHPALDWTDGSSPRDENHPASLFMESVRDSFLVQHVTKPTHYRSKQTPNILDLVFTSDESMLDELRHEAPLGKSHHQSLLFSIKCCAEKTLRKRERLNFAKGDYDKLREAVDAANISDCIKDMNVADSWSFLKDTVMSAVDACVPKITLGGVKKSQWMNSTVKAQLKTKKEAYKRYLRTRSDSDYNLYARARNQAKKVCRTAVKNFEKNIAKNAKKNPKAFFLYASSKCKTNDGISDLKVDQRKISSDEGKANVLNQFFSSVFTDEDLNIIPDIEERPVGSKLTGFEIHEEEVLKRLVALNPNKSCGPDGFHPRLLKELATILAGPLTVFFQKTLNEGTLPSDWKEAQVTPLFKKGDKSSPGNYRPVSLTSVVCKVMESVVRDRIIDHLTVHHLLSDCQHGFIAGRSCTTNLLSTLNDWTRLLDEREPVDALYLDFAKAFDSVPHERLLRKVKSLGIEGNVLQWIRDFLVGRRQRVSINGTVSDWASVRSGVPQGSVLGPILFVAFINDLPEVVSSVCSMYADDTKVYNTVKDASNKAQLQDDLDSLVNWADTWQLRFNADKCKVLHLGKNNEQQDYSMRRHGCNERVMIEKSSVEKDLGVYVDKELKFSKHVETKANTSNKLLGLIRRSYEFLDAETMKQLFVAVVRPNLEFGNVVWSPRFEKNKNLIENVQRRATRIIPGLKGKSYGERL